MCFLSGGNNTFCEYTFLSNPRKKLDFLGLNFYSDLGECFYLGVVQIIFGIFGDQICNAKRVEESGYGFRVDLRNYTEELLASTLQRALNDEEVKHKLKAASQRIQRDDEFSLIGAKIMNYLNSQL